MISIFDVVASVVRPVPLVGWSGSFLARVVKSCLSREVLDCGFFLSPLFQGGRIVLSGVNGFSTVLDAGSRVGFRFTSFCRDSSAATKVVDVLSSGSDFGVFRVVEVGFQVLDSSIDLLRDCGFCGEDRLVKYIDSRGRGLVEVFFGPTMFVFRGWRILYPSPHRLIFTLAKSSVSHFGIDPRITKKRARTLLRSVEVVRFGTRAVDVSIGRGRKVKAFMGRAVFGVQGLENLRDFVELLEVGKAVGVGRSRGIGFGYIDYRVIQPRV